MTAVQVSPLLARYLTTGHLAIDALGCTCKIGEGCDEEGVPGCAYCRSIDCEWPCPSEDEDRRHLLPLPAVPVCDTCGGSGIVGLCGRTDNGSDGPCVLRSGHDKRNPCYGEGDVASDWEPALSCLDCVDGVPRFLALTVECEKCGGHGALVPVAFHDHGPIGCFLCNETGRSPVYRVEVDRMILPVHHGLDVHSEVRPHLCITGPKTLHLMPDCTDVSHLLLPGVEWVGHAAIITRIEAL